ncbi:MAG TPA: hypothetical protein VKA84_21310 [Gemmatimonadaceae bacterium]|nr:hypothetical protein [Gemmatimonadaceae bacterium]
MRILSASTLTALSLSLLLAACSDAPTTVTTEGSTTLPVPRAAIYVDHMDTVSAVKSADITVTPQGGWFQLGTNGVYFPANTICDPNSSSYGVTEWDKSCRTIKKSIKIHAELDTVAGAWIVFTPDLRFRPSDNSDSWVYLFMYTAEIEGTVQPPEVVSNKWKINWLPGGGLPPVDESFGDNSLKTRQYKNTGYVYRRVKHFSGYQVVLGRSLEETSLSSEF